MPVPGGLLGKRQRHRHEPVLPGQPLASPIGSSTFSSCKCVHGQHVVPAVRRDPQHVPGEFHRAAGLDQQGNPWFYGPSARSIHRRRIHHRARRRTVLLGVRGDRHRRVNTWCWTGVLNQCPANTSAAGQLHLPRVGVHEAPTAQNAQSTPTAPKAPQSRLPGGPCVCKLGCFGNLRMHGGMRGPRNASGLEM